MAWPPAGDPLKTRTTGTTGILKTHFDCILWEERVLKEDAVHATIHNPDGFLMRNALRQGGPGGVPPQRVTSEAAGAPPARGWGPNEPRGRELREAMEQLIAVPRGRYRLPETTKHQDTWAVSTPSRPERSMSLPALRDAETEVESNRAVVLEAAAKRQRRRDAKFAKAEAGLSQALARSAQFWNMGAKGRYRPLGETDATTFQNYFVKASGGTQLHQTRSSGEPVLRDSKKNLVPAWQP
mmetsp:Transcript_21583/g.64867  ORF Transcript_21583/g.64867 Transcript_21583/m.64867 type:complete len:240 (-) Transcript_21583:57-776(-)